MSATLKPFAMPVPVGAIHPARTSLSSRRFVRPSPHVPSCPSRHASDWLARLVPGEQLRGRWPTRSALCGRGRELAREPTCSPVCGVSVVSFIDGALLKKVTKLEDMRNNIIHSPLSLLTDSELMPPQLRNTVIANSLSARGARLAGKDLIKEFRGYRDAVIVLRDHADTIQSTLYWHSRVPLPSGTWPRRPSLPNRGQKKSRRNPGASRESKPS